VLSSRDDELLLSQYPHIRPIRKSLRHQIDRDSRLYKTLYNQRSATERINSQAKTLGIERPKLRNGAAIANLNTLIYVLINLRALTRIQTKIAKM
jgi:hypothetical protein